MDPSGAYQSAPSQPLTSRKNARCGDEPVVDRGQLRAARGSHRPAWVVRRVDHAERLDSAGRPVLRIGLVGVQPVDVHPGDVDVRAAVGDPVRHDAADAAAGQDADRVQARPRRSSSAALAPRRRTGARSGVKLSGPQKNLRMPTSADDRDPGHGLLQERAHPVPVRRQLAEARSPPGCRRPATARRPARTCPSIRPPPFLAEVAVVGRVLQHRPVAAHLSDRLGQQVVVLGRLQRDADAGELAELTGPHARAVDYVLGLDVAVRRC